MSKQPEMIRRQQATQATLDRYRSKVFDWRAGVTCVHLARFHLKCMGHAVPTVPRIRSVLAAKRALAMRGWAGVEAMLDSMLPRIAPAQMLLGDLATVPGDDGFDCILVCAGPQAVMGWHPETGRFVVYEGGIGDLSAAWRV